MMESAQSGKIAVGLISDTHGRLFPRVLDIFKDVHTIVHAGDIGDEAILDELGLIAPVVAVRGNMDWGGWACRLAGFRILNVAGVNIGIVHDRYDLPNEVQAGKCRVIVSGHTHRAQIDEKNGVLFINPGSAGQPRAHRPASVAMLSIHGRQVDARIISLGQPPR